jgi:hypothetical protein
MGAAATADPGRVLEAAEESARIDHTKRQENSRVGRYLVATIRVQRGEVAEGLIEWLEVLRSYDNNGQRTDLALSLLALAGSLGAVDPLVAVEIGDHRSDIAPLAAFPTRLALSLKTSPRRSTPPGSESHDVYGERSFLFDAIGRLIAEPPSAGAVLPLRRGSRPRGRWRW